MTIRPGALVRYRQREWVVLPSENPDLLLLRPIGGSSREVSGVLQSVAGQLAPSLPHERIEAATFPLPTAEAAQDHPAVQLMQQAARLLLREGAAPFRSLGHLSIRPRPYQYVPLIMALRLETVRLLIADDVGVGKTIEAGLIGRELLDRGEIQRIAILCPPYLCEQWQQELAEKFHIEAVVIRSGTVAQLERQTPHDTSIFAHYRHIIASIDTVKSERYRPAFLQHCPSFVIVDEVHGAAAPSSRQARGQQMRHDLLQAVAENPQRHLVLLSATPHSGKEESFLSILGLLKPEFRHLDFVHLGEKGRAELARHFVQRRRGDVQKWMGEETPFPRRDTEGAEQPYTFSPAYRAFYNEIYAFARELVQTAAGLTGLRKQIGFWSALALMRCVSSSPAATEATLGRRLEQGAGETLDETAGDEMEAAFEPLVYDPAEVETAVDAPPSAILEAQNWRESERRRLRDFARPAAKLRGAEDAKLQKLIEVTRRLLNEGYQPIIWCRYIATADYVAAELQQQSGPPWNGAKITAVTGAVAEDERRLKVAELAQSQRRILVATDCLSEGINLQESFNAVVHYDLPWNPNRLEQREGRVDRYGQLSPTVKAILIFGQDNPVDGAVLEVLLRKARDIYRTLGVRVPVPADSATVMEAVLTSLFQHAAQPGPVQLGLFDRWDDSGKLVRRVHEEWTQSGEREKESQTRFAQHAIKPEEVEQELKETDGVLGSPADARRFLLEASQRLNFQVRPARQGSYLLPVTSLPPSVALRLGNVPEPWPITFESPTPPGLAYVGRNHPLIEGLAEYLLDMAFHPAGDNSPAARCGVIQSRQVNRRTTLLLLRLRFLQYERGDDQATLAEETVAWGFTGWPPGITPLEPAEAQALFDGAEPAGNVAAAEKQEILVETLSWWDGLQPSLTELLTGRAAHLQEAHRRVRRVLQQSRLRLEAQSPPDLLGVLVVLPIAKGVTR